MNMVLGPEVSFSRLDRALSKLGWERAPDTSAAPSLVPGEPEFASWSRHDDESISYTFNPVVRLRVLVFYGARAGALKTEVESSLPALGIPELEALLQSTDPRQLLLGVLALRELRALALTERLGPLRSHREATVARAAQKAHAELVQLAVEVAAERLREDKRQRPDRSVLFPRLGDAHLRRQTLRWLIRDRKESNEHIEAVLRSGLVDKDWEVRATAMLAAARLGVRALGKDVERLELPRTSREGPDETDRSILYAARKVVLAQLAGEPGPERTAAPDHGDGRHELRAIMSRHLWRCVAGLPAERLDRVFLLINALSEPLDIEYDAPPALDCVVEEDGRYRLRRTGIEVCWVAALPHWLGADDPDLTARNPIRRVAPSTGFFIARRPLSGSQARSLVSPVFAAQVGATADDESYLCNHGEAARLCEVLGQFEGARIDLPETDQREMAGRGTDGRRYPWGNGLESGRSRLASPWGLDIALVRESEWTKTEAEMVEHIAYGGKDDSRCAFRATVPTENASVRCAIRPVVLLVGS
ncbi:hypothetical protein V1279_007587 [Bradyrhizobium sp. AZCC 1610]|uniref:hypothetical protein n=1 Tax=Bradyrhizobium sp. AZCC 1610 TaxID=3117020 RepID=UPI002FF169EF